MKNHLITLAIVLTALAIYNLALTPLINKVKTYDPGKSRN